VIVSGELQGKTVAFVVAPEEVEQVELTEPWSVVQKARDRPGDPLYGGDLQKLRRLGDVDEVRCSVSPGSSRRVRPSSAGRFRVSGLSFPYMDDVAADGARQLGLPRTPARLPSSSPT
jgi:hypothetical protein